jgi:6-pyruvoyltetrahydropterin/6-carboxytetrahydropterin synthase
MPRYRVCKTFTVESGHMLSKHQEMCRYPHGHTRQIEVVLSRESLDENDMVIDFKLIKLMAQEHIERYDHRMAINSDDPLLSAISAAHPDSVIVFDNTDPTTEVLAHEIFEYIASKLATGFKGKSKAGFDYQLQAGEVTLEKIRVWETPSSWAEYGV